MQAGHVLCGGVCKQTKARERPACHPRMIYGWVFNEKQGWLFLCSLFYVDIATQGFLRSVLDFVFYKPVIRQETRGGARGGTGPTWNLIGP